MRNLVIDLKEITKTIFFTNKILLQMEIFLYCVLLSEALDCRDQDT